MKKIVAIVLVIVAVAAGVVIVKNCCCKPARPNIVLITVDALRADHLPFHGYERNTAPYVASLAERGIVFENCYASSCWTVPSMASILTSLYAREHGVKGGVVAHGAIHGQEILDDSFITLPEILKKKGYKTFGLFSNAHISKDSGMAQGFDHFKSLWFEQGDVVFEAALEWVDELEESAPYFLWIHLSDPHSTYYPRQPWIEDYARHPELNEKWGDQTMTWMRERKQEIADDPKVREALIDLYDSEINFSDYYIKELFEQVIPASDNRLIVFSSDHGEQFMEHGFLGHARTLFNEEIRAPLVIVPPGTTTAVRVTEDVSIVDIYPTILDYAGIEIPAHCSGRSLVGMNERPTDSKREVFSEFDRELKLTAVVSGRWKLLEYPAMNATYLFDLSADPGETMNVAPIEHEKVNTLKGMLTDWQDMTPAYKAPRGSVELTPEQEKKLKSLGYLR